MIAQRRENHAEKSGADVQSVGSRNEYSFTFACTAVKLQCNLISLLPLSTNS
jgi:hypothetical protein